MGGDRGAGRTRAGLIRLCAQGVSRQTECCAEALGSRWAVRAGSLVQSGARPADENRWSRDGKLEMCFCQAWHHDGAPGSPGSGHRSMLGGPVARERSLGVQLRPVAPRGVPSPPVGGAGSALVIRIRRRTQYGSGLWASAVTGAAPGLRLSLALLAATSAGGQWVSWSAGWRAEGTVADEASAEESGPVPEWSRRVGSWGSDQRVSLLKEVPSDRRGKGNGTGRGPRPVG